MSVPVIDAPDSMQPASVSYSSLFEKAMAHPAGNEPEPTSAPAPTPTPGEVVPPVEAVAPPAPVPTPAPVAPTPAEQKILDLPEDAVVRVKIDGQLEDVNLKDFKEGISREAVFTRRMQQLAEQRKEAETALAGQYAEIQRQAQAIELAKQQFGEQIKQLQPQPTPQGQQAPKALDPAELATMGDVQATLAALQEQLKAENAAQQAQFVKALGEAGQKVQSEAQLHRDSMDFTGHLTSVMAKPEFEFLNKVNPYAMDIVRVKVAEMDPKSISQAKEFADTYVKGWADTVKAELVETVKRQEVAKAQAKIEPPAGSPAPPVAQYKPGSSFTKDGKFNWDALRVRAEGML